LKLVFTVFTGFTGLKFKRGNVNMEEWDLGLKIQARLDVEQTNIFKNEKKKIENETMVYLTQAQVLNKIILEWQKYRQELENLKSKIGVEDKQKKKVA
jgi:hypothetical protein